MRFHRFQAIPLVLGQNTLHLPRRGVNSVVLLRPQFGDLLQQRLHLLPLGGVGSEQSIQLPVLSGDLEGEIVPLG